MPGIRSIQPASASTRRGPLSQPGVGLVVAFAVLLSALALSYLHQTGIRFGSQSGHFFDEALRDSAHSVLTPVVGPALCGIVGFVAFLVLLAVLQTIGGLRRRITGEIATVTPPPAASVPTQHLAQAPIPSPASPPPPPIDRSAMRDRSTDSRPPELRNRTIAQRHALHTAALLEIESRVVPPSTLRRFTDYTGPRRRATDTRCEHEYIGPHRRASDTATDQQVPPPPTNRKE